MPADLHPVLLNDGLKRHILGLEPGERRRLREKFSFLEHGRWDTGVRVKKLKGVGGRVVFEARASRGDRLLFTLGPHRGRTAIYVWSLVAHDDIGSAARRISPADAPFLDFASESEQDLPSLAVDEAPPAWVGHDDLDGQAPQDHGPQRWLVLDDAEWERILSRPAADSLELYLYLTREQAAILELEPPVLLSGTAGSGKTTLSVYYLLRGPSPAGRKLFLTYNEGLRSLCEGIYRGLAAGREDAGEPPTFALFRSVVEGLARPVAARFPPEREVGLREFAALFRDHPDHRAWDAELVWEEIRSIVKGAKLPLNPGRLAALAAAFAAGTLRPRGRAELAGSLLGLEPLSVGARVERTLADSGPAGQALPTGAAVASLRTLAAAVTEPGAVEPRSLVPALEAVVAAVRAADADLSRPLLSLEEYLALGRKRAPTFRWDRPALHAIARWYQDRLEASGSWDELDLCRAALQRLAADDAPSWDLVVCDEAQDFTDLQLSLVFRLARDPRRVVVTADPRQIVNPSGFRWEEVKNRFFERGLPVPEVQRLSLNFRSAGSIVRLANALLELKQNLVGLSDTETRERWKFAGRPPVLLHGLPEDEVLAGVSARAAGQAIIVREAAERDALKRRLGTEMVFTIREAKGLEFDGILLWKFAAGADATAMWRRIRRAEIDTAEHAARVRHELALLYVAVTRARNTLVIYDGPRPCEAWDVEGVGDLIARSSEAARLVGLWHGASSPAEWERQGDYLAERGYHAAALECFRNAGHEDKAELEQAHVHAAEGRHAEAAPRFARRGAHALAAASWERSAAWDEAAAAWEKAGEPDRAEACGLRGAEARGDWRAAAEGWQRRGETARAAAAWEKAGDYDRLAALWLEAGEMERAAAAFDRAQQPLRAAECLARAGRDAAAADRYSLAGEHAKAASLYAKVGNDERLAACLATMEEWRWLADVQERRGRTAEAAAALRTWIEGSRSRRRELEKELAGAPAGAAPAAGTAAGTAARHAAILRAALGDSAETLALAGRFLDAALAIEASSLPVDERLRKSVEHLAAHLASPAGGTPGARDALREAAAELLAAGKPMEALARYRALADVEGECAAYLALDRDEEAIARFLEIGAVAEVRKMLRARPLRLGAAFLRELVDTLAAGGVLASEEARELARLAADLLENALPGLSPADAAEIERRFLRAVEGGGPAG